MLQNEDRLAERENFGTDGSASENRPGYRPLRILYLGVERGTSLDRANALRRLGHSIEHIDLRSLLPKTAWVNRITWRIGGHVLSPLTLRGLRRRVRGPEYDVCLVDSGEWVTPKIIAFLHRYATRVVNYIIDDPLGGRDFARFRAYRKSLPYYDLCVVVRSENVAEAMALGAKDVLRVYMSSDEISHAPRRIDAAERARLETEVLFMGTWMPERGPFLRELVRCGVPLCIRGANWQKAPEWPELKAHWIGGHDVGDEYAKAIQCAKVNLGLLSKGNRDLHTTRSLEIPALGGLLCAERTEEHLGMYQEGREAIFWSSADECAAACLEILKNDERRRKIAAAGHARSKKNKHHNEQILQQLLDRVVSVDAARSKL